MGGYEILIVNDGSRDKTVDVALGFSRRNDLHDILRICTLKEKQRERRGRNPWFPPCERRICHFRRRGRSEQGSKISRNWSMGCKAVADASKRGIAVGSRAHLVGSEAVVKVCIRSI